MNKSQNKNAGEMENKGIQKTEEDINHWKRSVDHGRPDQDLNGYEKREFVL